MNHLYVTDVWSKYFYVAGITTFDLMGEFGRFDWLGNLQLILLYNLWFEVATAVCLMKKLTATVREALFERFKKPWKKLKSLV